MARILVTGGTGHLGRLVVPRLVRTGAEVRVVSRSPHAEGDGVRYVVADWSTGEGLAQAVGDLDVDQLRTVNAMLTADAEAQLANPPVPQ